MTRYAFTLGDAYRGPASIQIEVQAANRADAMLRLHELLRSGDWAGAPIALPGLHETERAVILTNPAYFPKPERIRDEQENMLEAKP